LKLIITPTDWHDKTHYLYTAVPSAIEHKIKHYLNNKNRKPLEIDEQTREQWDDALNNADVMLYPTKKTIDRANEIFNDLTDAIAFMAFVNGGVEVFGHRYEVIDGSGKT
jgi:hypothetical protein